jgi:pimeloyl-ACP methyl ester carboxylesterase
MSQRRRQPTRSTAGVVRVTALAALALLCAATLPSVAGSSRAASSPCPFEHAFTQPGKSVFLPVTVPPGYPGTMYRPSNTAAYPGHRPAIVLAHGNGGNQCALAWAARLLAAHGYVTLTFTRPTTEPTMLQKVVAHTLAVRKAAAYLRSPANPWHAFIDPTRLGLAGHSLGARAVSSAQQATPGVKAIVALDNLMGFQLGDPGIPLVCTGPPTGPLTPRVPALGFASDVPCLSDPAITDKLSGFRTWKTHGKPSMELVMRGFTHPDFTGQFPNTPANAVRVQKLRRTGYYMLAWFDRWLGGNATATTRLLSHTPLGVPVAQMFSARPAAAYRSAGFIPGAIDCDDLVICL